jgi:hypothetical protein
MSNEETRLVQQFVAAHSDQVDAVLTQAEMEAREQADIDNFIDEMDLDLDILPTPYTLDRDGFLVRGWE